MSAVKNGLLTMSPVTDTRVLTSTKMFVSKHMHGPEHVEKFHETAAIFGHNWNLWSWNAGPERWASLPNMTHFQIFN